MPAPERHLVIASSHDDAAMQLLASMPQGDIRQRHGFHRNLELAITPAPGLAAVLRRVPMDLRIQPGVGAGATIATLGDWGGQIEGQSLGISLDCRQIPHLVDRPEAELLIAGDIVLHGFFRKQHEDLTANPNVSVYEIFRRRFAIPAGSAVILLVVVDPEAETDADPAGGIASAPPGLLAVAELLNRISMQPEGFDAVALAVTGLERPFAVIGNAPDEPQDLARAVHAGDLARCDGYVHKIVAGLMEDPGHRFGMLHALANARTLTAVMPVSALGFLNDCEANFCLADRRPKWTPGGSIRTRARERGERNEFPATGEFPFWSPYLTIDPLVWLMTNLRNPFAFPAQSFLPGRQLVRPISASRS